MKRLLACAALGLAAVMPNLAEAHGDHYRGGYYYGGHGYYHNGAGFIGDLIALPFVLGAAVIGTAATIATAPFYAADRAFDPAPAYYAPPARVYYSAPAPVYYAPPRRVYGTTYYGAPAPVYVQPRVVYRSYYSAPPPPVYYEPAPPAY